MPTDHSGRNRPMPHRCLFRFGYRDPWWQFALFPLIARYAAAAAEAWLPLALRIFLLERQLELDTDQPTNLPWRLSYRRRIGRLRVAGSSFAVLG